MYRYTHTHTRVFAREPCNIVRNDDTLPYHLLHQKRYQKMTMNLAVFMFTCTGWLRGPQNIEQTSPLIIRNILSIMCYERVWGRTKIFHIVFRWRDNTKRIYLTILCHSDDYRMHGDVIICHNFVQQICTHTQIYWHRYFVASISYRMPLS